MSTNQRGLEKSAYQGSPSTLCTGCGHDSVTNHLVTALYQSSINPFKVAKLSGIGCSSKTPTYFLNLSHGFNSIHGRMAPVATGAKAVHRDLLTLGISGDGDTASIGLGGFAHLIRRNIPMVYLIENNGVYGLTKGQFSATADEGTTMKGGDTNPYQTMDLCAMALELGCGFVARSFSGDSKQLVSLLSAALRYDGTSVIDVISPCITFANHEGSTKSYNAVKEHNHHLQELGFIQPQNEITVDIPEGERQEVVLHDGSKILVSKLDGVTHDLSDINGALAQLRKSRQSGEILTGLFHLDTTKKSGLDELELSTRPIVELPESELRPSPQTLTTALKSFR